MPDRPRPPAWQRLYGLWAFPLVLPFLILETTLLGLAAWVVSYVNPDLATAVAKLWSRLALGANFTRVTLRGAELITPRRSYVIMANHQSLADIVALGSVLPLQFRFVMKQELRRIPVFGHACAAWGCVFVARDDRARAIESLKGAGPLLERGASLIVFPEGTRSPDGRLLPFKKGGFMVALALNAPILPVRIDGSAGVLPARSLTLRPGQIRVTVLPPIDTAEFGLARRDELMAAVRQAIDAPAQSPADTSSVEPVMK